MFYQIWRNYVKAVYFGDNQISLLILTHLFQTHPSLPPENIKKS